MFNSFLSASSATVSTLMTDIGSVFTTAIGWVGKVVEVITGNPLLLVFTVLPLVGLGVGFFKRLMH